MEDTASNLGRPGGAIIAIHALIDPARVSVGGAPLWGLSMPLLISGLLIAGLRARRDLAK